MNKWKCLVCGYVHNGPEPPEKCPVCGADKSKFILLEEVGRAQAATERTDEKQLPSGQSLEKWRCPVCGYMHKASEAPVTCPVCGSENSQFVGSQSTPANDVGVSPALNAPPPEPGADIQTAGQGWKINTSIHRIFSSHQTLANWFTRLHAHPIAVHIPNGVLPVTVIFALLALIFRWEVLALAAKCNMIFVCLSMPVVILTGFVDWQNRFAGRMSRVFSIKMACAAAVFIFSLILAWWGIFQADVYLEETSLRWLFLVILLADLAAAAVAGWYGGKLVFPNND